MVMIWPTITLIDTIMPRENATAANQLQITSSVDQSMVFESGMQIGQVLVCCISCNGRITWYVNNNARKLSKLRFLITLQCIGKRHKRNPRLGTGKKHQTTLSFALWTQTRAQLLTEYEIACGNQMAILFCNWERGMISNFAIFLRFLHNFDCFCTLSLNLRPA